MTLRSSCEGGPILRRSMSLYSLYSDILEVVWRDSLFLYMFLECPYDPLWIQPSRGNGTSRWANYSSWARAWLLEATRLPSVQIEARAWEEAAEQARTSDLLRRNEEEERPCWPELYESRHDAAPPEVFRGPFEAAHQAAREEKRLLLVWTLGAFRDRLHGTIWNQYVFII